MHLYHFAYIWFGLVQGNVMTRSVLTLSLSHKHTTCLIRDYEIITSNHLQLYLIIFLFFFVDWISRWTKNHDIIVNEISMLDWWECECGGVNDCVGASEIIIRPEFNLLEKHIRVYKHNIGRKMGNKHRLFTIKSTYAFR